jgi:hypothetical protein
VRSDLAKGAGWAFTLIFAECAIQRTSTPGRRRAPGRWATAAAGSTVMSHSTITTPGITSAPYEVRVASHLDDHWATWIGDLPLVRHDDGTTVLTGPLADQSQLHGLLARIRDLGIPLLSLSSLTRTAVGPQTAPRSLIGGSAGRRPPAAAQRRRWRWR